LHEEVFSPNQSSLSGGIDPRFGVGIAFSSGGSGKYIWSKYASASDLCFLAQPDSDDALSLREILSRAKDVDVGQPESGRGVYHEDYESFWH
jgi:hypothetical protein